MIFNKQVLPALFASTCFLVAGHQAIAKASSAPTPTVQNENTPTNLGAGMYLMKEGGMWGSVMHLNEPNPHHSGAPAAKADLKAPKKPDLCVASDQNQTLILRASANGLEVRSVGKEWNLQKDVLTSVKITVGKDYQADLTMQALSKDQIGVPVNLEQMVRLVDALSNNNQAVIAYAPSEKEKTKAEIRKVSLKMAGPVFDDFRECVRFSGLLHANDAKANVKKA